MTLKPGRKSNRALGDYDMAKRLVEALMDRDQLHEALERAETLLEKMRPLPALVIVRQALYPPIEGRLVTREAPPVEIDEVPAEPNGLSPVIPELDGVPEDDTAEPDDAQTDNPPVEDDA